MASAEVDSGYAWLTESTKLSIPDEVMEDNEERKVVTRYTPIGTCTFYPKDVHESNRK